MLKAIAKIDAGWHWKYGRIRKGKEYLLEDHAELGRMHQLFEAARKTRELKLKTPEAENA